MSHIVNSHYFREPRPVDLDALTEIVWSGWTGDYFPKEQEANGVYVVINGDSTDEALYNAIAEMVETWEAVEDAEIGGVIYRRKGNS